MNAMVRVVLLVALVHAVSCRGGDDDDSGGGSSSSSGGADGGCAGGSCAGDGGTCRIEGIACSDWSQCCSGACTMGHCGAQTCKSEGATCQGSSECCSGSCLSGVCGSCVATGGSCASSNQCCGALPCRDGLCFQCTAQGGECSADADCCSGLPCNHFTCGGACRAGETTCGGHCADLERSSQNCGSCGFDCIEDWAVPNGLNGAGIIFVCGGGQCGRFASSGAGQSNCSEVCTALGLNCLADSNIFLCDEDPSPSITGCARYDALSDCYVPLNCTQPPAATADCSGSPVTLADFACTCGS